MLIILALLFSAFNASPRFSYFTTQGRMPPPSYEEDANGFPLALVLDIVFPEVFMDLG